MRKSLVALLFITGLIGTALAVFTFQERWRTPKATAGRPRFVLINETRDHRFDQSLKMNLRAAETRAEAEVALILLPDLPPGQTLESIATNYFSKNKIGARHQGRGILVVYIQKENRLKIHVSPNLQLALSDLIRQRYEESARVYRAGTLPQAFLSQVLSHLSSIARDGQLFISAPPIPPEWYTDHFANVAASSGAPSMKDISQKIKKLPKKHLTLYQPTKSLRATVNRYLFSLANGVSDPQLAILTEGSQVARVLYPQTEEEQREKENFYRKAGARQMEIEGDFGLVVFKPGLPHRPLILRRQPNGTWLVDEAKSQTYFYRFENSVDDLPKYDDLPVRNALIRARHPNAMKALYKNRVRTPPASDADLLAEEARLVEVVTQSPASALAHARLAEFYLFEINWLTNAKKYFDQAAILDPQNLEYHWRLYDLALHLQMIEEALYHLDILARLLPRDAEVQDWKRKSHAQSLLTGDE